MKIAKPHSDPEFDIQAAAEMADLLRQPLITQQRPCHGCEVACPCSASVSCACGCSVKCPHVARQMSSDPDNHPVEQGIAPLVFALNGIRVVEPCWSCEGHMGPGETLLRPPSVWFYSRSAVYPMMIADYLAELSGAKETKYRWRLCMVAFGDDGEGCPVFSIEPNFSIANPDLMMMRRDVRVIAEGFEAALRALASAGLPCRETGLRVAKA